MNTGFGGGARVFLALRSPGAPERQRRPVAGPDLLEKILQGLVLGRLDAEREERERALDVEPALRLGRRPLVAAEGGLHVDRRGWIPRGEALGRADIEGNDVETRVVE